MVDIIIPIGDFFVDCFIILIRLIGGIVAAGLILGGLKRLTCQYMQYALGFTGILITAWIGTPVHELGHAFMCYIFQHRIKGVKLFDPKTQNGILGYVNHAYDPRSIYQKIGNFFIGIAPILSGTAVIMLIMAVLLPTECSAMITNIKAFQIPTEFSMEVLNGIRDFIFGLFKILFTPENVRSIAFWIFMYLAISISSHMAMSIADMKGASSGIGVMYLLIVIVNLFIKISQIDLTKFIEIYKVMNSYLIVVLIISIFCSFCSFLFSLILYLIRSAMA